MQKHRIVCVLVLLLVAGCDSLTEPDEPFEVTFTQQVTSKGRNDQTNRHECTYTITASAKGGDGGAATWLPGEVQYRYLDGTSWTFQLDLVYMLDFWGSDRIAPDAELQANRISWDDVPFRLVHTFRYMDPKDVARSESVFIDCM